MSIIAFNKEIKELIDSSLDPVVAYVNDKFKNSDKHNSYYGFFEDFLCQYGIITVGCGTASKVNMYEPYVNCKLNNIFKENKDCTNLTNGVYSLNECHRINANYIISNLKRLNIEDLENWNNLS